MSWKSVVFLALVFCLSQNGLSQTSDPDPRDEVRKELLAPILEDVDAMIEDLKESMDTVFLCKCTAETVDSKDGVHKSQDVYIYLVRGKDTRACYTNPALTEYDGFYEKWQNEAPAHPRVFKLTDGATIRINSRIAQELGCGLENRMIMVSNAVRFPDMVKKYYPDLDLDKK